MSDLSTRLCEVIASYGVQCSETKVIAPSTKLVELLNEVASLERKLAEDQKAMRSVWELSDRVLCRNQGGNLKDHEDILAIHKLMGGKSE